MVLLSHAIKYRESLFRAGYEKIFYCLYMQWLQPVFREKAGEKRAKMNYAWEVVT